MEELLPCPGCHECNGVLEYRGDGSSVTQGWKE